MCVIKLEEPKHCIDWGSPLFVEMMVCCNYRIRVTVFISSDLVSFLISYYIGREVSKDWKVQMFCTYY